MTMKNSEHERQDSPQTTTVEQSVCAWDCVAADGSVDFEILLIEKALEERPSFPMEQRRAAHTDTQGDFEILLIEDALREAEERLCSSYELPSRRFAPFFQ